MAIKSGLGRLTLPEPIDRLVPRLLARHALTFLAIGFTHTARVCELPHHHADPFDRMLVAQAQVEGLSLITADARLADYEVTIAW